MKLLCIVFLVAFNGVLCEDCVTVDFENDFKDNFTNSGVCATRSMWTTNKYSSVKIDTPHPRSTSFVAPQSTISCMASFNFTMHGGGTLEVNRYMSSKQAADYVIMEIFRYNSDGSIFMVVTRAFGPSYTDSAQGWQTSRIPIPGSGKLNVYILFWGRALSTSILLIDSFRYIGPSFDKDLCVIYKEVETTVTETPTTTQEITTMEPTTEEITTTTTQEASTTTTTTSLQPSITTKVSTLTTDYGTTPSTATETSTTTTELPIITTNTTTTAATTSSSSTTPRTSTSTPRLSISVLLVKIKKFFR